MSIRKYQIFISSTFEDLKEERKAITEAILEEKHIPIGMELFSTSDTSQWEYIKKRILESDYYVLIVGYKYGSIDNTTENKISYTEKEYNYAIENNIPIMSFIIDKNAKVDSTKIETDGDKLNKLSSFKDKVQTKLCKFYNNKDELKSHFKTALNECIVENPKAGWIKADELIVKENMMRVDLDFVIDLLKYNFEIIENESIYSFYDYNIKNNNIKFKNAILNFNEMYRCINPSTLMEYIHKKHYDVIYISMFGIKEKLLFLLSNPNMKIDFEIIKHFYLFLSSFDKITSWYNQLKSFNIERDDKLKKTLIDMIKENKEPEYKQGNLINIFVTYYNCINFIREWINEFEKLILIVINEKKV